jgi:hypothetical protein
LLQDLNDLCNSATSFPCQEQRDNYVNREVTKVWFNLKPVLSFSPTPYISTISQIMGMVSPDGLACPEDSIIVGLQLQAMKDQATADSPRNEAHAAQRNKVDS